MLSTEFDLKQVRPTKLKFKKIMPRPRKAPESPGKLEKCLICTNFYANLDTLKRHISDVHEERKNYECNYCKRHFSQVAERTRHINEIHMKLTPFNCTFCNDKFAREETLKSHILAKHPEKTDVQKPIYQCIYCPKTFTRIFAQKRHVKLIHEKIKKFTCEKCGKPFSRKDHLKTHSDNKSCKKKKTHVLTKTKNNCKNLKHVHNIKLEKTEIPDIPFDVECNNKIKIEIKSEIKTESSE